MSAICNQDLLLFFRNPENIKDKTHQMMAKRELEQIGKWCEENNVSIGLHNQASKLEETLNQLFRPVEKNEDVVRLST